MTNSTNIGFDLSNFARNKHLAEQYNGGKDLLKGEERRRVPDALI